MYKEYRDNLLGSFINRGVKGGGVKRGEGEGLKGGTRVGIVVGVESFYLNIVGLFH